MTPFKSAFFFDPARADKHPGWFTSTQTPAWILAHIMELHPRDDNEGIINCIELLGAICLLFTYQEEIWGRKISIFQDNSTAFYTMISGASDPRPWPRSRTYTTSCRPPSIWTLGWNGLQRRP